MVRWCAEWASLAVLAVVFGMAPRQTASQKDLELWWADLGNTTDGAKAYRAMGQLAGAPAKAVPFLGDRLRPVAHVADGRVPRLIADLGSEKFAVRDKAQRELEELQDLAEVELAKTLEAA